MQIVLRIYPSEYNTWVCIGSTCNGVSANNYQKETLLTMITSRTTCEPIKHAKAFITRNLEGQVAL